MIPSWLLAVLADNAHLNLDHPDGRSQMAERIVEALPMQAVAKAIATTATQVLESRSVRDGRGDIGREIGNNAAQTAWAAIGGIE